MSRVIQNIFGGEAAVLYKPATREVLQILDVIGGGGLDRSVEAIPLNGGSYQAAVGIEYGMPENSLSITARQIGKGLFTTFENAEITEHAAEINGYVSEVKALSGAVSDYEAAAITGKAGNLPFGKVIVRIVESGKARIIVQGSLSQGPTGWQSEDGAVMTDVAATAEGTIQAEEIGLEITLGAAITVGNAAMFEVRPPNSGGYSASVGRSVGREIGVMIIHPRQANGSITFWDMPRVSVAGLPLAWDERAWAEFELTGTPMVDLCTGELYSFNTLLPKGQPC
jgi:hypothetical protein